MAINSQYSMEREKFKFSGWQWFGDAEATSMFVERKRKNKKTKELESYYPLAWDLCRVCNSANLGRIERLQRSQIGTLHNLAVITLRYLDSGKSNRQVQWTSQHTYPFIHSSAWSFANFVAPDDFGSGDLECGAVVGVNAFMKANKLVRPASDFPEPGDWNMDEEDEPRTAGFYALTERGVRFLQGGFNIPVRVLLSSNKGGASIVRAFSTETASIGDYSEHWGYDTRPVADEDDFLSNIGGRI